jgi:non-homologous end joining protein Ku
MLTLLQQKLKEMAAMAARAIWKGSISFGLVNIPIQVFQLHREKTIPPLTNYVKKVIKSNTRNGVL